MSQQIPDILSPQLATLALSVPSGDDWLHEVKLDGYRILVLKIGNRVRMISRNGKDWSKKFSFLIERIQALHPDDFIMDGEVVALNTQGISDFQLLQNSIKTDQKNLHYYAFDLLQLGSRNLMRSPLIERKTALRELMQKENGEIGALHYSDHIVGNGERFYRQACKLSLEGIISKKIDSVYIQKRSKSWLKIKCVKRQEFVIGGYTDPKGARTGFGALLLGFYREDRLVYCGKVGTGFNEKSLREMHNLLKSKEQDMPPFHEALDPMEVKYAHWVNPEFVCEVEYGEWTEDGRLRHPTFKGLREDKLATEVTKENPGEIPQTMNSSTVKTRTAKAGTNEKVVIAGISLTNPDRVMFPEQGITKRALAEYYDRVERFILPFIADRPLSLVRCPQGRSGTCFFQKHVSETLPDSVYGIEVEEKKQKGLYITIRDKQGLIALVQHGTLEFHPQAIRNDNLEKADQMIFDLDPNLDVSWQKVVEAAFLLRDLLSSLELKSYVKTSGGKGLHVFVPLMRSATSEEVKEFAGAVVKWIAKESPGDFTATMSKAKRKGRIFIDYFRNGKGSTCVAAYSTRARAGAPVSLPLDWSELPQIAGADDVNVINIFEHLSARKSDPWADFFENKQSITKKRYRMLESLI